MNLKKLHPILFVTLALIVLASTLPTTAFAKSEKVKFTVNNKSDKVFALWLTGPEYVYLVLEPDSAEVFTPLRGEYDFTMLSCGVYADGKIDLSTRKTMVVPECGSGGPKKTTGNKLDASDVIKLVKITVENNASNSNMVVVLTGPGSYVFSLKAGKDQSYTIPRGDYDVTYYACSSVGTRKFIAKANKVLELSCPK
jgi:hypothetical protein